jgi:hypothetical protein
LQQLSNGLPGAHQPTSTNTDGASAVSLDMPRLANAWLQPMVDVSIYLVKYQVLVKQIDTGIWRHHFSNVMILVKLHLWQYHYQL